MSGILKPTLAWAVSSRGCSASRLGATSVCSDGTASGCWSGAATTGDAGCSLAIGRGAASILGFRKTRRLTRFTLTAVLVLNRAGSFGVTSSRGCSASRLGETSTCSDGTASGCWSGAVTTSDAGCSPAIGRGAASILGFRMTRRLTRFTLAAVLVLNRAGSFGFRGVTLSPPSGLAGLGFGRRVLDSGASGMGEASGLGLRTTRLLTDFTLAAVLALGRAGSLSRFVVLLLPSSSSAGMGFLRRVFGLLRVTRRIARAVGFKAFPERAFFVFIPGCYPFGGYRILSDAPYTTAAARQVQRETGAEKVGNLACE